jgi:hypothetical protein
VAFGIPQIHRPIARYFRSRRFRAFQQRLSVGAETRIVDVGGYAYYWGYFHPRPRVTVVNLEPPTEPDARAEWVIADACRLPFREQSFDIAFSNSVVEHIPSEADRRAYASEIQRVGRSYYVQTPYRWFPVEPHLLTPLIHYLPKRWRRPLLPYTVWGLLHKPTPQGCDDFLRDIRLLDVKDLRSLFPRAAIWKERALGLLKSITAVGGERSNKSRARA